MNKNVRQAILIAILTALAMLGLKLFIEDPHTPIPTEWAKKI